MIPTIFALKIGTLTVHLSMVELSDKLILISDLLTLSQDTLPLTDPPSGQSWERPFNGLRRVPRSRVWVEYTMHLVNNSLTSLPVGGPYEALRVYPFEGWTDNHFRIFQNILLDEGCRTIQEIEKLKIQAMINAAFHS